MHELLTAETRGTGGEMGKRKTNINTAAYVTGEPQKGEETWRYLDLSGEHLGVRIEVTPPNGTSSHHHYHTAEEEHVLVLSGKATLHLGDDAVELSQGDHVWFPAGEEVAHHIENTSSEAFKFLVFGERKKDEVVFYPNGPVMLVKSATGAQQYRYEKREVDD
jgi:uncharacterized cupin superfamily protein